MQKSIESVLVKERNSISFSVGKLSDFLYGQKSHKVMAQQFNKFHRFQFDDNLYNNGRQALLKYSYKEFPKWASMVDMSNDDRTLYLILSKPLQMPNSVHIAMFIKYIEFMGTQQQKILFLEKSNNFDICGCYAQTQIGHGSDVQNLQTTATYIKQTGQFIINTPSISATKYWPGDLGLNANHALVFAQLILSGHTRGVQAFVVKIRDQNHKPLPGVQVGDIGPKIGFNTKDNGYLILNNVRIPKNNMITKYLSITQNGQLKKTGDPKYSYATMMYIRQHISITYPKVYAQAISIAIRYSFFRTQFLNSKNQQIPIIQYITQQQKLVPRIAQYYAIVSSGRKLKNLCEQNLNRAKNKQDFSLLNETHACLCMTKAYYSEIVYAGMQICRRSCGGHGFSAYSGFPSIIYQYSAHLTHQGQNTIMYLQVARFLMKSYKYYLTKKKQLAQSVKYIESFDYLMEKKCESNLYDPQKWTLEDIRILLAQSVCYLISVVVEKLSALQEGMTYLDNWNQKAGSRLHKLALAHACYYTFTNFRDEINKEKDYNIRQVLNNLCTLYGVNTLLTFSQPIIEGGFVQNQHLVSLSKLKLNLIKKLRPSIIGLTDGFCISEHLIRSQLAHGNPYENYFRKVKQSQFNKQPQQSAIIIRDGIQQSLKPKL